MPLKQLNGTAQQYNSCIIRVSFIKTSSCGVIEHNIAKSSNVLVAKTSCKHNNGPLSPFNQLVMACCMVANSYLFTHKADTELHYYSFGVVFLDT